MDAVEPGLLDEVEIEHREVRHRAYPRRIVGAAKPGMLRHQHLMALGQRIEERQPLRDAPRAVQEQHRRPAPGAVHFDPDAPDLELGELRWHLVRSLSNAPTSRKRQRFIPKDAKVAQRTRRRRRVWRAAPHKLATE